MEPSARSVFRFIALMAAVVFAFAYLFALLGTCELLDGGDDVCLRSQKFSARSALTWAVVSAIVLLVSLIATKLSPNPSTAEAFLRDKAWNTNSGYSREAPAGVLTFERAPLAALRVTESGPSLGTSAIHPSVVTMLRASLPTADGATRPIGTCLASREVKGDLPSLVLMRGDFDPALIAAFGLDEINLDEYDLILPWRAFGSAEECAEVFTQGMVGFLNSQDDAGVAIQFEPHRVVVWSDRGGAIDQIERFDSLAWRCADALPKHLSHGGDRSSTPSRRNPVADKADKRRARLGSLESTSKVRSRLFGTVLISVYLGVAPAIALALYILAGVPFRGSSAGLLATGILVALIVVTVGPFWVSDVAMNRLDARHEAIAREVRDVASDANLIYRPREHSLERHWTRPPFSILNNLGAAPSASALREWGSLGVAYIEGDYGAGALLLKAFQSRVAWAQVNGGLPRMDLVREGFASRAAKLVGGAELDTESYEFNELWRITTDHPQEAHAMLEPRMIDFLTTTAERGIAIHLDGDRVVIWDDGSDETVELAARLELVERFVECLPSQLRPTGDTKKRSN